MVGFHPSFKLNSITLVNTFVLVAKDVPTLLCKTAVILRGDQGETVYVTGIADVGVKPLTR